MLNLFFSCIACKSAKVSFDTMPLCVDCSASLVAAPPLCKTCSSPVCASGPSCLFPWRADPIIESYAARYLLVNPGYKVLRKWKVAHGPLFDRRVLKWNSCLDSWCESTRACALIPVPQNFARSWKLGGSPALKIASWLSKHARLEVLSALMSVERSTAMPLTSGKRQAELSVTERLRNTIAFSISANFASAIYGQDVILVDDFLTSGHTVREASSVLRAAGARRVHVFVLGLRPFRFSPENVVQNVPEQPAWKFLGHDSVNTCLTFDRLVSDNEEML